MQVWNYFAKSDDKKHAKCLTCGKEYKTSGNTSNLRDHLKRFHPNVKSGDSDVEKAVEDEFNNSKCASTSRQSSTRSVASYFKRAVEYDKTSKRKQDIDCALAKMVAEDYQPLNVVENKGFKHLVRVLDPRYVMPSAKTLKNVFVKNRYDLAEQKLKAILSDVRHVSITCDGWTSMANENYITVTCHFVDDNFVLRSAVLSTNKLNELTNHSASNISNSLKFVLRSWSIFEKVSCIVTDNANAMICACNLLEKRHMPCVAHTLNLLVQDALNGSEAISKLRKKCKVIVTFFKSSTIANEKLKIEQRSDNPYSLLQEVPTRWNSVYLMFERITSTNEAISRVLLSTVKAPSPLTAYELLILKDLNGVLKLFADASNPFSFLSNVFVRFLVPVM